MFALGSLESRAAARSMLAELGTEDSRLPELSPFVQAMSEGEDPPGAKYWKIALAQVAEESLMAYGLPVPTPDEVRHKNRVYRLLLEMTGGEFPQCCNGDFAEEKRLRDLAEANVKNKLWVKGVSSRRNP